MKRPNIVLISILILLGFIQIFTAGCKKKEEKVVLPTLTITDVDGNVYDTIHIGAQVWIKQNLKVTHYNNGEVIPNVTDATAWSNLSSGAYCDYDNASTNSSGYGRLYNWYAVNENRKICPTGWHVPTSDEWLDLFNYLGGINVAGLKLKEQGTTHWNYSTQSVTNSSRFSALPAGERGMKGTFGDRGTYANFWTSTPESSTNANVWVTGGSFFENVVESFSNMKTGYSVRCIKN